jgi:hypothetical protein
MNDIEQKALALLNEVACDNTQYSHINRRHHAQEALCRAIEQHEAFRQEVSDAVEAVLDRYYVLNIEDMLSQFIIPKPKPDPLVEIFNEVDNGPAAWGSPEEYAAKVRAALDARGLEIREKNGD